MSKKKKKKNISATKNKLAKKKADVIQRALTYNSRAEEIRLLAGIVNSDYIQAIKSALAQRGIIQSMLAERTGLSPSYISQVFNETRMLNIPFITRIRREFHIPLELVDTSKYYSNITIVLFQPIQNINLDNVPVYYEPDYKIETIAPQQVKLIPMQKTK